MEAHDDLNPSRRRFLTTASASAAAALFGTHIAADAKEATQAAAAPTEATTSFKFDKADTAVVIIDPQNDVLSEKGLAWPLLHESLKEINTIENLEHIFVAAKGLGSKSSFPHTISSPRIRAGSSTDPSKRMKPARDCSAVREG
jgi:hypothetical protein